MRSVIRILPVITLRRPPNRPRDPCDGDWYIRVRLTFGTLHFGGSAAGRRCGVLAQWQSSGLLIHGFRVRIPGAPPSLTSPYRQGAVNPLPPLHPLGTIGDRQESATGHERDVTARRGGVEAWEMQLPRSGHRVSSDLRVPRASGSRRAGRAPHHPAAQPSSRPNRRGSGSLTRSLGTFIDAPVSSPA
jgi:hypothetical protein